MMVIVLMTIMQTMNIHACLTTFINDKAGRVIIYNKIDKTLIPINKNEKRRFGNQHQKAHFAIYVQQSNQRVLSRMYTCKQIGCDNQGNIQLKLSDIEKGNYDTQLFTITQSKPYSPMVEELPIVQKKTAD